VKYLTLRVTCLSGLRKYYNICGVLTGWRAVANLWWWSTASSSPSTFPLYFPCSITLPTRSPSKTRSPSPTRSPSTLSSSPSTQKSQSSSPPCSPFSTPSPPLGRSASYHRRSRSPYRRGSWSVNDCRHCPRHCPASDDQFKISKLFNSLLCKSSLQHSTPTRMPKFPLKTG